MDISLFAKWQELWTFKQKAWVPEPVLLPAMLCLLSRGSSFLTGLTAHIPVPPQVPSHPSRYVSLHSLKSFHDLGWNPKSSGSGPCLCPPLHLLPLTPLLTGLLGSLHHRECSAGLGAPCSSTGMLCPQASVTASFLLFKHQFKCHLLTLTSTVQFSTQTLFSVADPVYSLQYHNL